MRTSLADKRVLVVEDELLISMLVEEILADQDCCIVGPFTNLPDALLAAMEEGFDLALLDVNLRGEKVYPVAEILAARGIPFVFMSGYGPDAIPSSHPDWRVCSKPFTPHNLTKILIEGLQDEVPLRAPDKKGLLGSTMAIASRQA